jgi:transposase
METELWLEIRRLHLREKIPKKAIARRLGVDVKTVRRAIRSKEPPGTQERARRPSILDPYKPRIREILEEHSDLSAVRILEEIKKDGYPGEVTTVRKYVARLKKKKRRAFLRLSFPPGDAAQVDWGHCGLLPQDGVNRKLSVFAMTLCHSRLLFAEFTFSQSLDELLRCHQNAFRYFSGVVSRVIYDNMRTVVLSRAEDRVRFHPRFLDFCAHYLVKPVLCRPGEPQEKGRVERAVGYLKGNFLAGRSFRSLADVNERLRRWLDETANVRIHGTTRRRPVDLFQEERPLLAPLPAKPYDTRILRPVLVTADARVRFETNTYTVPPDHVGERLVLRASPREVTVYAKDQEVARHERCSGRHQDVVDPAHVQAVLKRKARASTSVLLGRLLSLGAPAKAYVEGMVKQEIRLSLHVKRIVALVDLYGKDEVLAAIEDALAHEAYGAHYVQHLLLHARRRENRPPVQPLLFPDKPELEALTLPERDLADYDRLLGPPGEEEEDDELRQA